MTVPETTGQLLIALDQFIDAFATTGRTIVLVLEDLESVDSTTRDVLTHWSTEPRRLPMLVIGAYRSKDLAPGHPLAETLRRIGRGSAHVSEIALAPLRGEAVLAWIADLFQSPREDVAELAGVVSERAGGNPLYIARMLESLHESGRIRYSVDARKWQWNIDEVRGEPYADDVAELIVENIARLAPATQNALGCFAAYGSQADPATLAIILGCSEAAAFERLTDAFAARLVARVEGQVSFLHDRIRQVAYDRLGERRVDVHLQIGRALLTQLPDATVSERIFDIVRHFELAAPGLDDPDERSRAAELELIAGRRAQIATQYASSAEFLARGMELLSDSHWETHHDLAFGLRFALARARYVTGEHDRARDLATTLLAHARTGSEEATVRGLLAETDVARGAFEHAVLECAEGLRALGVDLPIHPTNEIADSAPSAVIERLTAGDVRFADLPQVADPAARAICDLLSSVISVATHTDWNLLWLAAAISVDRSLIYGNAASSAIAYGTIGLWLVKDRRYADAFRIGVAAYALARRDENAAQRSRASYVFCASMSYLEMPMRDCIDLARHEGDVAASLGDICFASYLQRHALYCRFFAGDPLPDIREECTTVGSFVDVAGSPVARSVVASFRRLIARLRDTSATDPFAPTPLDAAFGAAAVPIARFHRDYHDLVVRYLLGDFAGAVRAAEAAAKVVDTALGCLEVPEFHFYAALAQAAVRAEDAEAARAQPALVRAHHDVLRALASSSGGFGAREALVAAEIARLGGDELAAEHGYERAVRAARSSAQVHVEAIANECAARFHRARGIGTVADAYLAQAYTCYETWGALRKTQNLLRASPFLTSTRRETPDVDEILKAQHVISSTLLLPQLHLRLLDLALEHASAQRGCLIEVLPGTLRLVATRGSNCGAFGDVEAAVDPARVPVSVCLAAVRMKKPVLIADAEVENRYAFDPYFSQSGIRSVLCMPIVREDRATALLYLENNLVGNAFSARRLGVLDGIASQAAISLENAKLYSRLEQENIDRQRAEASLAETKKLLESILDAAPIVVFVKDRTGRYLLTNRNFAETVYANCTQINGKTDYDLFPHDAAAAFSRADRQALEEDRAIEIDESLLREDGLHHYLTIKFPIHDAEGKPYGVCGIATDVTGRTRADDELRKSLSLVEATIESTADGILVTDLEGRIVRYNRRFLSMWSIPEEIAEGGYDRHAVEYVIGQVAEPAAFAGKIEALYAEAESESFDMIAFKDGRVLERYSLPQRISGRVVGRVWSFRDVTHRVRAAEERSRLLLEERQARAEAEEAVKVRDEFLSIASHELRTPLMGLSLAVDSLGATVATGDEEFNAERVARAATIAKRQVRRIVSLVEMLLDVSRLRAGKLVLSPVQVDLRSLVEEASLLLASELLRSGSELVVRAPSPVIGRWDGLRLEQVITNLLTNAIKFGRGQPIVVEVTKEGAEARVTVSDQGIGIAAERRARIFDPFTRLVSSRNYGGLGLGLHIAKSIVEAHGGKLTVESEEGVGATFTVALPLRESVP